MHYLDVTKGILITEVKCSLENMHLVKVEKMAENSSNYRQNYHMDQQVNEERKVKSWSRIE